MVIEIREWEYPDTLEKMVMNELVAYKAMNTRKIGQEAPNAEMAVLLTGYLNGFMDEGYVTSSQKSDALGSYTEYNVTDFFLLMVQEQRARVAEQERLKLELWEAQQRELLQNTQRLGMSEPEAYDKMIDNRDNRLRAVKRKLKMG